MMKKALLYFTLGVGGFVPSDALGLRNLLLHNETSSFNETGTNATQAPSMESTGVISSAIEVDEVDLSDYCIAAETLTVSALGSDGLPEITLVSTTDGAPEVEIPRCRGSSASGPSVWYKTTGTGGPMVVTTCLPGTEQSARLTVLEGNCTGDSLTCVAANDFSLDPSCTYSASSRQASRTEWQSKMGRPYYIVLQGWAQTGQFEVAIQARNDLCEYSQEFSLGEPVVGDTSATTFNLRDVLAQCGYTEKDYHGEWHSGPWSYQPRGLWYKVIGTGGRLQATTCNGDNGFNAHRIHVFEGSCNQCLGGEESPVTCVTYEWDTDPGVTYYVAVHKAYPGYSTEENVDDSLPAQYANPPVRSAPAPFELTITEVNPVSVDRKGLFD